MRMIFKVSYYVRSNYENKQGKSPLMIRIFLNGEMLPVSTLTRSYGTIPPTG